MIKLYKSGDTMGIETDCLSTDDFLRQVATLLSGMIDNGMHEGDWEFQLHLWLPQIVEIACKLKGYKADVKEQRILMAGDAFTMGAPLDASIDNRGKVECKSIEMVICSVCNDKVTERLAIDSGWHLDDKDFWVCPDHDVVSCWACNGKGKPQANITWADAAKAGWVSRQDGKHWFCKEHADQLDQAV